MAMSTAMSRTALPTSSLAAARSLRATSTSRQAIPRRSFRVRAEKSAVDDVLDKIEDKAQDFVEATKENSGLNLDNLNKQGQRETAVSGQSDKEWQETFSFSGLLPEIINGRAAMIAMLAAFGAELRTGLPVLKQIQAAPVPIAAAFAIIIIASVIPVARNANLNINGAGPFTQRAEVWNGRLAMVSFALLLAVETWKAGPGLVL